MRRSITFALAVQSGTTKLADVPSHLRDRVARLVKTASPEYLREYAITAAPSEPQRNARLSRSG
jgi:hypothetical protein